MAIMDCDPDLLPKPASVAAPASRPAPPPPAAVQPAPAPPRPAAAPAKPAAAAAPARCDATVTLQNDEMFAFNKAILTNSARSRLDKDIIGRLARCATLESVAIEGHADRLGSQQYNQKLSEKRADAVKAYLVSKGTPDGKIETIGMGKTVPAKSCPDTKNRAELIACLAPNRRVSVSIKGPGK
ncbi:MAG: OmpA family protein [Betaproteobacteria bacterium]|nr:OmpA family protein [Betaproteobacteria bacterium]